MGDFHKETGMFCPCFINAQKLDFYTSNRGNRSALGMVSALKELTFY
jgi:hypothetical protein